MFDWNDIRAFLAVARGGSTLAGAKTLGVNQTTVARRIESLEQDLRLKLFERGQSGSRLTEAGRDLMEEAERVEQAAMRFASRAEGHQRGLAGVIRLSTTEMVANTMVLPALAEFREKYPEVQVDLMITDRAVDLEAGEADLAIRTGYSLAASDLIARKLGDHEFALYCSRDYAGRRGLPTSPQGLKDHDLIGLANELGDLPAFVWIAQHTGNKTPVTRSTSMTNMLHAVKAGLGIAPLPCGVADADRDLVRCSDVIDVARATSWLMTRRELKDVPRIRAFIDFMAPFISQELKRLEARAEERLAREAAEHNIIPFPTKVAG